MYNTIAHNVTYRGYGFTRNIGTVTGTDTFFALTDFSFINVDTNSSIEQKQLQHGYIGSYTRNVARYIDMSFGVFARSEQERFEAIKLVNTIFEPPSVFSPTNRGYYDLSFVEPDGHTTRTMQAKVVDRPSPSNYDNTCWIEYRVRMIVGSNGCRQDSCMYSGTIETISDTNHVMGTSLQTTLDIPLWYQTALCKPKYSGPSPASLNISIVCTIPYISNGYIIIKAYRSDGQYSVLWLENMAMNVGDILYIDGNNQSITLNGFDISGNIKQPYGVYPKLYNGDIQPLRSGNNFCIVDIGVVNPGIDDNVLDVTREWRNTRC